MFAGLKRGNQCTLKSSLILNIHIPGRFISGGGLPVFLAGFAGRVDNSVD